MVEKHKNMASACKRHLLQVDVETGRSGERKVRRRRRRRAVGVVDLGAQLDAEEALRFAARAPRPLDALVGRQTGQTPLRFRLPVHQNHVTPFCVCVRCRATTFSREKHFNQIHEKKTEFSCFFCRNIQETS